jgi:hypothetical protein
MNKDAENTGANARGLRIASSPFARQILIFEPAPEGSPGLEFTSATVRASSAQAEVWQLARGAILSFDDNFLSFDDRKEVLARLRVGVPTFICPHLPSLRRPSAKGSALATVRPDGPHSPISGACLTHDAPGAH